MSETRIGTALRDLFGEEENRDWGTIDITGHGGTELVSLVTSSFVVTGAGLRPAPRPLDDVDFRKLLESLQGSIDRTADATQSFAAELGSVLEAVLTHSK